MKTLLLTLALVFSVLCGFAQDIIVKKNGEEISAKIIELTPVLIKYTRADYVDGPIISLAKREVFMIKFANGTKEVINPSTPPPAPAANVYATPSYEEQRPEQIKLGGPRFGFTVISGSLANQVKEDYNVNPFLTQFGWQFETRLFTTPKGLTGLVEVIPLIGGLEQGKFLPSISALIGMRGPGGFEFGVGPNLTPTKVGLAFAIGTNLQSEGINFPINLAFVPSNDGARFSLLFGFNTRKY